MTARALVGLLPRGVTVGGTVLFGRRHILGAREKTLRGIRGNGIALIPQDPFTMLSPVMRCGPQVLESLDATQRRGGLGRRGRRREVVRRLAEVNILDESVYDAFPFELSGGMRQRVGIAAALAGDPQILIADEPATALDVSTQQQVLRLLLALRDRRRMSLMLITHDLRVAAATCERIAILYAGSLLETGSTGAVAEEPLHPYTLSLLQAEPPLHRRVRRLHAAGGAVPAPDEVVDRCPFQPRCQWAGTECVRGHPPLVEVGGDRKTRCVRIHEIDVKAQMVDKSDVGGEEATAGCVRQEQAGYLLVASGVSKVYSTPGRRRQDTQALDNASIAINEAGSVGLVGESGSGKTTLSRCIVGLESLNGGSVTLDGMCMAPDAPLLKAHKRLWRQSVQMVFQDPYSSLNPRMTVGSALREASTVASRADGSRSYAAEELLEQVGLSASLAGRKPAALSGGQRQRVAIARALCTNPKLLICDEPVSALDLTVQAQIINLLKDLRRELNLAYLFVTHDLAVARQMADWIYVMYSGRIVEEGPTERVLGDPQHEYTNQLISSVPG